MWISKNKYENLMEQIRGLQNEVKDWQDREQRTGYLCQRMGSRLGGYATRITQLEKENGELRLRAEEYKQKYADEVQKRLALIEQMEAT